MEENDFVSIWLEESGNPAIEEITKANQEVANKIENFLSIQPIFRLCWISIIAKLSAG